MLQYIAVDIFSASFKFFMRDKLKVPKCKIFHRSDLNDFYTIKSLREGDCGVKIKKIKNKYLGVHLGPRIPYAYAQSNFKERISFKTC